LAKQPSAVCRIDADQAPSAATPVRFGEDKSEPAVVKRIIVVIYSLTGHTRRVGAEIAQRLHCPLVEISDQRPRKGVLGFVRSALEALFSRTPAIREIDRNLADFDAVVVGTPVWAGHLCSPVRSFLTLHRPHIRALAAFCTMGGTTPANTFLDITSTAGRAPIATLALRKKALGSTSARSELERFVAAVDGQALHA
jgi:flavodoxin